MDVSIIIVNYNTFALTCACIQSVIDNTKGVRYEIILVDNRSIENDPDDFLKKFPGITLIKNKTNVGFAKGNNVGISSSSGKYILLLNSDTVLKNNAIQICQLFLERHPQVGVVSARLEYPDGTFQHNCQRFPSVRYKLFEFLRLQKIFPADVAGKVLLGFFFDYNSVAYPDWVWGTFFLFEKKTLRNLPLGRLSDDFFLYVEDLQWCFEFQRAGYKIGFEPAAQVIHYMGKSGGSRSDLMKENTNAFMKKYYHPWHAAAIGWMDRLLN